MALFLTLQYFYVKQEREFAVETQSALENGLYFREQATIMSEKIEALTTERDQFLSENRLLTGVYMLHVCFVWKLRLHVLQG
jgi:hypothetical protein